MRYRIILYISALFLSSCTLNNYYQLATLKPLDVGKHQNFGKVTVSYDFWGPKGKMQWTISNKTDSLIFLRLDRSMCVLNGEILPFCQNVTKTVSVTSAYGTQSQLTRTGMKVSIQNSNSESLQLHEFQTIYIAPGASYHFVGPTFQDKTIRFCSFIPKRNYKPSEHYDPNTTPITLSNFVVYRTSEQGKDNYIHDSFYLEKIENYSHYDFVTNKAIRTCEEDINLTFVNLYLLTNNLSYFLPFKGD